jgi:hydrogenase small subunit
MPISRRDFLKYCGASAAVLGLTGTDLLRLEQVLANPAAPTVLWLHGSSCSGCSVSFLNYISASDPTDAGDIILNHINLAYHPVLMEAAGQSAAQAAYNAYDAYSAKPYVLVVEGSVPTAFSGRACWPWTFNGVEETFQSVVIKFADRAVKVVCAGTCSSFGGIPAAGANPTAAKSVNAVINAVTGKTTLNLPGCPPHPNWIAWAVVQLLLGNPIATDSYGRPTEIYGVDVHEHCPREDRRQDTVLGGNGCLMGLGCRGPGTYANCPTLKWNNGQSWCIEASAPCYGCTEPDFPGTTPFYQQVYQDD